MHEVVLPASRLARVRNAFRHPDQAAIMARVPLLRRRVPVREFWRRQPIDPGRISRHAMRSGEQIASASLGTAAAGISSTAARMLPVLRHGLARGGSSAASMAADASRRVRGTLPAQRRMPRRPREAAPRVAAVLPQVRRSSWPWLILGFAAGLLAMYYGDPRQGRRRRALVRDKLAHTRNIFTRRVPRTIERRARFFRGVATGVAHEAADFVTNNGGGFVDDETLVARVRSEVLRPHDIKAGEIHIDAYEGCVTLRGQLQHPEDIRRLVDDTRAIEGVREVRSYLHLPGTPPPNKAEVLIPAHLTRAR